MKSNCLGCTNRTIGCHSTCEIYKQWKNGVDKKNEMRRKVIKKHFDSLYHK